jgi:PAS domain S-box-containing protein
VTRFDVFNEPLNVDLTGQKPIKLSYTQNFISFEFSAFDFQSPQKNQYAYKLEGLNNDWIQAGNHRYATYTNLPGGNYVFRVKASNSDGVWNATSVSIPVVITPPFWQTWWFVGSLIVGLGMLVAGGFRWRLNTIREQNIHLETQISERTSELRETNSLLEKEVEQRKRAEEALAKRTAEQLHQSEERFRVMFENAGIGIALVGMDRRPLEANAAIIKMTGYSKEEFLALSGAELSYSEDENIGMPELKDVLEGRLNTYQIEKRYVRKGGQIYWVRLTNSVVRDPDGKPQYFVTMIEDIDEQKHAAEELQKSQARFQALFDNVAVGIAVMTLDRRPIAFNPLTEKIVGYTFEEMRTIDPRMLAVPEDRDMDIGLYNELIEGKRNSYIMERRYRQKDGRIFWARINYSLVRDLDGKPDYLVGIIEDIDEQRRANERLAEQEAEYLLTLQQRVQERTQDLEEVNKHLHQEIEQRIKIEKELSEKAAEEAVVADRTRLARDLHDAVTQTLFSASLIAEVLPDLWEMDVEEAKNSTEELRQLTRGALAEMRTLLLELRPATLTQTRLSDLIKQLCEAFIGRSRLPIKLNIEGDCALPPEVQVAFYRIAQESLNNVFKYARATQVDVNLFVSSSLVRFSTCDNGVGFDMSTSKPTSLGMRIMRERAEAIGAEFQISSTLGSGTCIEVAWNENPNLKLRVL